MGFIALLDFNVVACQISLCLFLFHPSLACESKFTTTPSVIVPQIFQRCAVKGISKQKGLGLEAQ